MEIEKNCVAKRMYKRTSALANLSTPILVCIGLTRNHVQF
jgi:hypothetical protein